MEKQNLVADRISKYEEQQKRKLVQLGNSKKSYNNILSYLESEIKQSKQMADFRYSILCFRDDGVYQLNRAIEEIYGVASRKEETNMSGDKTTMSTIDITLSDGTRLKVPYGTIELPDAGEEAHIWIGYDNNSNTLLVTGKCEFRFSTLIDDIIEKTKYLIETESIYRNQAIEINDDAGYPSVLDLQGIDKEFIVLSDEVKYSLIPLDARINKTEECISKGIPIRYGALLEGAYGTGKTLLAFKKAKEAILNGWTFIYLKKPELLAKVLRLSQIIDGKGVLLFVEDIDQVTRGNRDSAMQEILNTLDGGDTKDMNVVSLFTTNHLELIEPTFLRGKRIGSIISMGFLNEKTTKEYIEISFDKDNYEIDYDGMDEVYKIVAENDIAPAFMAEIVEAVKTNMILTNDVVVKASYLMTSIKSYLRQVLLSRKKDMTETPENKLVNSLNDLFFTKLNVGLDEINEYLEDNQCYK